MNSQSFRPSSVAKRAAILDAAAQLFVRDGYDPASVDEIAASAGVSKPTIYSHFESKANLFVQVLENETARAFSAVRIGELAPALTAAELPGQLRSLGDALLDVVLEPRMVGLRRLAIAESHRFSVPAAAFARGGYERSVDALAASFAEADVTVGDPQRAAAAYMQLMVVAPTDRAMFGVHLSVEGRKQHVVSAVEIFLAAFGR